MLVKEDYNKYHSKSILHKTLNLLEGILLGLKIDNKITNGEYEELKNWYYLNKSSFNTQQFQELINYIEQALNDNFLSIEEIDDMLWFCNNMKNFNSSKYYDAITSDIQKLQGILYGIIADNTIEDNEIEELKKWIQDNESMKNTYPYDEVYSLLLGILKDNKITNDERNLLKVFFSDFIDKSTSYNINELEIENLRKELNIGGLCSVDPKIIVKNKSFCFTGTSSNMTRNEFAGKVQELGGFYNDRITNSTDFLIVGNDSNPCWAFSCYGRKIEKAMALRKKGSNIIIAHENDFWDAVQ